METIIFGMLLAILVNLPMVFRARHQLRLAEARLEIARTITEMEKLMMDSTLKMGEVCHDRIYQNMLKSQYATKYFTPWKFWRRQSDFEEVRKKLHEEMSKNTPLAKLLVRYGNADFKAFRNSRPCASFIFLLWVLAFAGGFLILLIGLFSTVKISEAWCKFKQRASETYVISSSIQAT
jgi:hypothetical protein